MISSSPITPPSMTTPITPPPSLKEQALEELEQLRGDANSMGMGFDAPTIRRALEALPND